MNERIRKLAEEAQIWIADFNGQRWEIDPEKFAELIVKECAAEADKQTIYCRGIPWGRWIKEHFGLQD